MPHGGRPRGAEGRARPSGRLAGVPAARTFELSTSRIGRNRRQFLGPHMKSRMRVLVSLAAVLAASFALAAPKGGDADPAAVGAIVVPAGKVNPDPHAAKV